LYNKTDKNTEIMTQEEIALNGTVEIVKNWLSKGVSSEIAILKLNQSASIELSKKIVRLAELALLN
jgi:hypothetical protein